MKVYVCIPSLNEAGTITQVTRLVDRGLQNLRARYGDIGISKIVNIDSASEDGTADIFRQTQTDFQKVSVIVPEPRGKGRNLLEFLSLARSEEATHCVTIDADVRSATAQWINDMLSPILEDRADFTTPLYERSRFEGSTTNHFAYPVVFSVSGQRVRQPIAGEFAFNAKLLDVITDLNVPQAVNFYGIDIYLTLVALTHGLRHHQVVLGKKVHNPSFHKLEYMLPQIASVALSVLRNADIESSNVPEDFIETGNIIPTLSFPHKDAARLMQENARLVLTSVAMESYGWVPSSVARKVRNESDCQLSCDDWVDILISWLRFGLLNKAISADEMGKQLLPFFTLRATGFWFASELMTAEDTEKEVDLQARMLHARFQKYLSGVPE